MEGMQPAERIPIIKRIAKRLEAEDDWAEIDFILEQFGFRTEEQWSGTMREYARYVVAKGGDDGKIEALDRYLTGHSSPDEEPWEEGMFRLFITHVAKKKLAAHQLKSALLFYGIDAFVAHDDIEPGKDWQRVIEAALRSCQALAALLHNGVKSSNWCDQEVGIAHGLGVPVVPVRLELDPYGFLGSVQAIAGSGLETKDLAWKIVVILLRDKRTGDSLTEAIVERLVEATSFDQANRLAGLLADEPAHMNPVRMRRLRAAQKENTQIEHAFDVEWSFTRVEKKLGIEAAKSSATAAPPKYYDEEPF
jgi:hypothetical protein